MTTTTALTVGSFGLLDEAVRPLLDELALEYSSRYGDRFGVDALREELERYPADQFAAPDGALILLLDEGVAVAGGAFRLRAEPELGDAARLTRPGTRDADGLPTVRTAEYKRIWTHSAHRRRGLSRRVLAELEVRAVAAGYERLYLTTGPRQPEAAALLPGHRIHPFVRHRRGPRGDRAAGVREVALYGPALVPSVPHPLGVTVSTLSLHQDESRLLVPPPVQPGHDEPRVVGARHPGRWIATAIVAVLLAMVVNSLVTNPKWEWGPSSGST